MDDELAMSVDRFVSETLARLDETDVRLVGVMPAREVSGAVSKGRYLHAGPSIATIQMTAPMRNALVGALMYEGEADNSQRAVAMLEAGEVTVQPAQDVGCAGGMTGIVSPSMPVVVASTDYGVAFSPMNEGLGRSLRFGSASEDVLKRLRFLRDQVCPLLDRAIQRTGGISLTDLQAEALRRGDDCHNRNVAASAALLLRLAPSIFRVARAGEDPESVFESLQANPGFFGAFSMASSKALVDAAHGIDGSPIVTGIGANGVEIGIRVSGLGSQWFRALSLVPTARFIAGYQAEDGLPSAMGDSFVAEAVGLGAFALSAAPATCAAFGIAYERGSHIVRDMRAISAGVSSRFRLPVEDFEGAPLGIDIRKVVQRGVTPIIAVAVAHKHGGHGAIGAGLVPLPLEPFVQAHQALQERSISEGTSTHREYAD